jgi:hypothetical protein
VRFFEAIARISSISSSSDSGSGNRSSGWRYAAGMSSNSSSEDDAPITASIARRSSSVSGM